MDKSDLPTSSYSSCKSIEELQKLKAHLSKNINLDAQKLKDIPI
ncbi:MAG: hypothetical protein SO013_04100 [Prevotella sp.]|nr:hypothetical protein [Prevotella sp.]